MSHHHFFIPLALALLAAACGSTDGAAKTGADAESSGSAFGAQLQGNGQGPDAMPSASAFGAQVQGNGQGPDVNPHPPAP